MLTSHELCEHYLYVWIDCLYYGHRTKSEVVFVHVQHRARHCEGEEGSVKGSCPLELMI